MFSIKRGYSLEVLSEALLMSTHMFLWCREALLMSTYIMFLWCREVLLMSTNNICFYAEIKKKKLIPQLSSNAPQEVPCIVL